MAKVKGPLFSITAGGKLGDGISFQGGPSGARAQLIPTHRDMQTAGQMSQRAIFTSAVAAWNNLSGVSKAYYETLAAKQAMTGYNLFIKLVLLGKISYAPWLDGYDTRILLTIDHTKIDGELMDFPVLVKMTGGRLNFAHCNADGFDVRFTQVDGETLLKYERERHDNGNSLAEYFAKIPTVSPSVNTGFYMYYRTEDTGDGADPTNVWDSDFVMVQHMKDDPDNEHIADSTGVNDGTKGAAGAPGEIDGRIAKGQDFDGIDDYINCGHHSSLNLTEGLTVEASLYYEGGETAPYLVAKGPLDTQWIFKLNNVEDPAPYGLYMIFSDDSDGNYNAASGVPKNGWVDIAGTYDRSNIRLYKEGVADGNSWEKTLALKSRPTSDVLIGNDYLQNRSIDGRMDEVRISKIARSAEWLKATHFSNIDSLLTYGGEESK